MYVSIILWNELPLISLKICKQLKAADKYVIEQKIYIGFYSRYMTFEYTISIYDEYQNKMA